MASVKIEYAASSALTITLASVASSSTWVAGAESDAVDNSSNKYLDYLLAGKITTGTSPTANPGTIYVWVVGILDDTTWPDVIDGTGSAETWTSTGIRDGCARLVAAISTSTTSDVAYFFGPVSVANAFGGSMPLKFVVYVSHNTGVNLNATAGNHAVWIKPVYQTVT